MSPPSSLALLPIFADGSLPPIALLRQWLRDAREEDDVLGCERIPFGSAALPHLALLGNFSQLRIQRADLPQRFLWKTGADQEAPGLAVINQGGCDAEDAMPLQYGNLSPCPSLPVQQRSIERVLRRVEAARLADAAAVHGGTLGADWRPALAALQYGGRPPPVRTQAFMVEEGPLRIWNPLPFARRCVAALPAEPGTLPLSLLDNRGVRHPVQVVEGPMGEEWLTELQLGALEVVDVVANQQPAAGAHWEVHEQLLDNGRLRVELNQSGAIERMCCDGTFIAIDEPLVRPRCDDQPLNGTPVLRVLEQGPTRARVLVSIEDENGLLRIMYSLHAQEEWLHIAVTWNPYRDQELVLEHPLAWNDLQLTCATEAASWTLENKGLGSPALDAQCGLRWVCCKSPQQSLAILGQRPLTFLPYRQQILVEEGCVYALGRGERPHDSLSLGQAALALSVPGRHAGQAAIAPAVLRLADEQALVAAWAAKPQRWALEVLFIEDRGHCGQAEVYPSPHINALNEAHLVDADGASILELERNKDGDAWLLPFQAHDILILRMR